MYDVTIIGAGVAGVFLAYILAESGQNILILDKGKRLFDRDCPLNNGEVCSCKLCDTYYGFGGLGKSEGKFNYSNGFGGELEKKVGTEVFLGLMKEVDDMLCRFGGNEVSKYSTHNTLLAEKAMTVGLKLISTEVRHLGSSLSFQVFQRLYQYLQPRVEMQFQKDIFVIERLDDHFTLLTNDGVIQSKEVVIATGRSGTDWLQGIWKSFGIGQTQTRVDLGIRVEMKAEQFGSMLQDTFETKLAFQQGIETATTYCMNPQGRIVRKYQDGLVMPDGQNYREQGYSGTSNLNFTLFIPRYFPTQKAADAYAHGVIKHVNQDRDRVVVQRWGDLYEGRSTSPERLNTNQVLPTLHADCGDLKQELPHVYVDMLKKFFARLERLLEEPIHPDTLLYGIDAKFYAPIMDTDQHMQTKICGMYVIGDCSGITHSLSQAAASGLYVGKYLRLKNQVKGNA